MGASFNISVEVPNLESEGGTATITLMDESTATDVTGSFSQTPVNISFTKVEE